MPTIKSFLGSSTGLVVCVAAAALGLYLLVYHLNHVLLAVPYLFLFAGPLMHLMHRGHHHGHHQSGDLTGVDRNSGQKPRSLRPSHKS